jgi:RimJ/RimL family protein N-acetyltransferase
MDAVPTMDYTEKNAINFMEFLKYTEESDEELELGIFEIETNKFIGMCTLENINREYSVCELGYWLDKAYVGNGYMTECVNAIIQYAKNELHMKSVNAFVITEHKKSIALLERLGFVRKELLENDTENKGKEVNRYWYKLLLQ